MTTLFILFALFVLSIALIYVAMCVAIAVVVNSVIGESTLANKDKSAQVKP